MNIVGNIRAKDYGAAVAIRDEDLEISYDELFVLVDEIRESLVSSAAFSNHQLPRVGVRFPNGLGYILLALAVIDLGACFVPIPDELSEREVEKLIGDTALHAMIEPASEAGDIPLPLGLGAADITVLDGSRSSFPEDEFEALNPAFIRFSSGTTSSAKGVVLSHRSLLDRLEAANQGLGMKPGETVLWTLPMAHHFAVSIMLYLYHGATTVLETSKDADEVYLAVRRSGASVIYGSPFHFAQLAQSKIAEALPKLRLAVSTAAALSEDVAKAFFERFNLPITQALGIIEVGLPIMNTQHALDRPTALGQVQQAYSYKIKFSGDDTQVGELLLRGPGMFDAYLLPWKRRDEITEDGWFSTGDLVEELEGQTLVMRGRSKSVINVAGMKVFPEEVEAVLNELPAVKRSRVFGVEHPMMGAYPCAEIILEAEHSTPPMRELRAFCESRLASYKIPVRLKSVESIDLTASGKVKR
ncbi:class I adenylate-forming enzyme family protein [Rubritalea sp.]|uniref:class I adenylate-forming enzyme family protein n=1 Tax=Rubritalea sp. TaxID=2109375 RepID=UPI003EF90ED5